MKKHLFVFAVLAFLPTVAGWAHMKTPAPQQGGGAAKGAAAGVEVKTTPVRGPVYILEGPGGNIAASVGEDNVLLVDTQFAANTSAIRQALTSIRERHRVRFVVNTHWHGDHTGGNELIGAGASILAHANVRPRLMADFERPDGRVVKALVKTGWPVITFKESVTLHFNGEDVDVVHFPAAHTDGDSVVFFKGSDVVHMGDLFFAGKFPYVDLQTGGNVEGCIKAVEAVLARVGPETKIIPGHGPLSSRADLEEFLRMLNFTVKIVRDGMAEGKSLKEIRKAGFPEECKPWGEGFVNADSWMETIYKSYGGK